MTINYAALRTEIQTDPTSRGYAPFVATGSDNGVADLLNVAIVNNKVDTMRVSTDAFVNCVVYTEFIALTTQQRDWLKFITGPNVIDMNKTTIKTGLTTIFGAATTTRANVIAAQQRDGSRAETLFGVGVYISAEDVATALRG
jgi:hypothetical protein